MTSRLKRTAAVPAPRTRPADVPTMFMLGASARLFGAAAISSVLWLLYFLVTG